ncbi:MAG: AAA family ATPase [Nitrospira sp.]|nr:AAA family ATPase [Nitrospira sp.]
MQGKFKVYLRNLGQRVRYITDNKQSAIILGPRQTGKTTLVKQCLSERADVVNYPLQNPQIRIEMETDPSRIIRQIEASPFKPLVFIDEAQKVPEMFDSV